MTRAADTGLRARRYIFGSIAYLTRLFSVASPIPLVAPAKTATRVFGREDGILSLDSWISGSGTIFRCSWLIAAHLKLFVRKPYKLIFEGGHELIILSSISFICRAVG